MRKGVEPEIDRLPVEAMTFLLSGHFMAQSLHAVAVLGIPDLIAAGQRTVPSLAGATKTQAGPLRRIMRALASVEVFEEDETGAFSLTPLGETLRSDVPGSLRDKAIVEAAEPMWSAFGALLDCLRTGEPSFQALHGAPVFHYLAADPTLGPIFNRSMSAQSERDNAALIAGYPFADMRLLVDVGGGYGATLGAVLRAHPRMNAVLFDIPDVIAGASIDGEDWSDRCRLEAGDMRISVPAGGDGYLLKRVLMNEPDEVAVTVLRNCAKVMVKGARVILVEPALPDRKGPHPNWLSDILMLATTGGACRTVPQLENLLNEAGLALTRTIEIQSPNLVLEAVKA